MNTTKILQIIPAPANWRVLRFELFWEDGEERLAATVWPVVCLALVHIRDSRDGETWREVMPLAQQEGGDNKLSPREEDLLIEPGAKVEDFLHEGKAQAKRVLEIRQKGDKAQRSLKVVCGDVTDVVTVEAV